MAFNFDPQAFMATSYDQANSETRLTLPDGYEGVALIIGSDARLVTTKQNGDKPVLTIKLEFSGPEVEVHTKREKFIDSMDLWLDINEAGMLDMSEGMNVDLGKLRAAVNQNQKGMAWNPKQLIGQVVKVKHTLSKEDPTNPGVRYSRYSFKKSV